MKRKRRKPMSRKREIRLLSGCAMVALMNAQHPRAGRFVMPLHLLDLADTLVDAAWDLARDPGIYEDEDLQLDAWLCSRLVHLLHAQAERMMDGGAGCPHE